MTIQNTDEDAITREIKALLEFYQDRVDWPEARRSAKYVVDAYETIKDGIEKNSMSYEEKLYALGIISLGAALGHALAPAYVVVVRGEEDTITEGELN